MMKRKKEEKKAEGGQRGPTYYSIDCHDFAEDDAINVYGGQL